MQLNTNAAGYKRWQEVGRRLHQKNGLPSDKVGVEEMDLQQLLEIEKKFLEWYPTTKSPDKEVKNHIYKTYIQPRIEELSKS